MSKLWFENSANVFEEALPIGNGRIGAMVYGKAKNEKISLNEDTLWSGFPEDKSNKTSPQALKTVRELMAADKKAEAQEHIWKNMLGTWTNSYQPAGNLIFDMNHSGKIENYYRELDLETAVTKVKYSVDGIEYTREIFCSNPQNAIYINLNSSEKNSLNTVISLESIHPSSIKNKNGILELVGNVPQYAAPSYYNVDNPIVYGENSLKFCISTNVVCTNGTVTQSSSDITVENADSICIVLTLATNFEGYDKQPKNSLISPSAICEKILNAATKEVDSLANHIKDYQNLYNKASIKLDGKDRNDLPTDERVVAYQDDNSDVCMQTLLFDYGRYLMIASSRKGTQATNLQGIWNEELRAPWSSNYTTNINAQMNYWLAENCNLSECHEPMFDMIRELSVTGARTARISYGIRGWCLHSNTDLWRQTESVGKLADHNYAVGFSQAPTCGPWLARQIWDHYEYTNDLDFLEKNWDILRGSAEFLLDYLVEKDGELHIIPSTSPENHYRENGTSIAITNSSAMDIAITLETFTIAIKTVEILNLDYSTSELKNAIAKLPAIKIGSKGQVLEWDKEYEETEVTHRHLSLLYGLYPAYSFKTKELKNAAKVTMELRGDDATGWSLAWKINMWARLQDGERALKLINMLLRPVKIVDTVMTGGGGVYANLFDAHPPFQIDGNFGYSAGVAEMLMQSHEDYIEFLPAIPKIWENGSFSGLCARNGFEVNLNWENGTPTNCEILSKKGNICRIKSKQNYSINCGNETVIAEYKDNVISFKTEIGKKYIIN